jgi:hypothetical protein
MLHIIFLLFDYYIIFYKISYISNLMKCKSLALVKGSARFNSYQGCLLGMLITNRFC